MNEMVVSSAGENVFHQVVRKRGGIWSARGRMLINENALDRVETFWNDGCGKGDEGDVVVEEKRWLGVEVCDVLSIARDCELRVCDGEDIATTTRHAQDNISVTRIMQTPPASEKIVAYIVLQLSKSPRTPSLELFPSRIEVAVPSSLQ